MLKTGLHNDVFLPGATSPLSRQKLCFNNSATACALEVFWSSLSFGDIHFSSDFPEDGMNSGSALVAL
jgi:hypothetical protein